MSITIVAFPSLAGELVEFNSDTIHCFVQKSRRSIIAFCEKVNEK